MISDIDTLEDPVRYYRRSAGEFGRRGPTGSRRTRRVCGVDGQESGTDAVRSCHDARRNQLAALAEDLLNRYTTGRSAQVAKERLVDFATAEVVTQVAVEDDAYRTIAASPGGADLVDAMPAGPELIHKLIREIDDNHTEAAVSAATGALVLLLDARAAVENAVLSPAMTRSPNRAATLAALLGCCGAEGTGELGCPARRAP